MPTEASWLVENRVMYSRPNGVVTLDELAVGNDELTHMIHAAATTGVSQVHLFINAAGVLSQPSPLETRKVFTYTAEPALGWTAIGGVGNPIMIFFTKIVSGVAGGKTRIFETPEEALLFLNHKDESLPDLLALFRELQHG